MTTDGWVNASAYDRYMGRWSRMLAREFVHRLDVAPGASWLEIGCGTGALTSAIVDLADPAAVVACDTASDFVSFCREHFSRPALSFVEIAPGELPSVDGGFDAVVSNLVLNFLPSPVEALLQMRSACTRRGMVAATVWDYSEGMEFLRLFWDTAVALDPAAEALHEGSRFPIANPHALAGAFQAAALESVTVEPITIPTTFASFEDFWQPLLAATGPAPFYVSSLNKASREKLEERLRAALGEERGAPIALQARAWAAKGLRGGS